MGSGTSESRAYRLNLRPSGCVLLDLVVFVRVIIAGRTHHLQQAQTSSVQGEPAEVSEGTDQSNDSGDALTPSTIC